MGARITASVEGTDTRRVATWAGTTVPADVALSVAQVEALEEETRLLRDRGRRSRLALGRVLWRLRGADAHRLRGYTRWGDYVRDRFGFTARWASDLIALAKAADEGADVDAGSIRAVAGRFHDVGIGRQRVCAEVVEDETLAEALADDEDAFGSIMMARERLRDPRRRRPAGGGHHPALRLLNKMTRAAHVARVKIDRQPLDPTEDQEELELLTAAVLRAVMTVDEVAAALIDPAQGSDTDTSTPIPGGTD
jgi:hypothetical protein